MTSEFFERVWECFQRKWQDLQTTKNLKKFKKQFEIAMEGVEMQTEKKKMDMFLEMNQSTLHHMQTMATELVMMKLVH